MRSATFDNGFAVGGMDLALHDLCGKALGVPVHALHGGAERERVQAYASMPGYFDDETRRTTGSPRPSTLVARLSRAMKFRIGRFAPDTGASDPRPSARGVGSRHAPDGRRNAAYSPALARRTAAGLHELDFEWLEEPLPQNGYLGYPELRAKMPLPLAGGEGADHPLRPRTSCCVAAASTSSSPTSASAAESPRCLFIGELAQLSQVRCIPHCWAGAIMLAATLHVAHSCPEPSRMPGVDAPQLEFDVTENPFRDEVCPRRPIRN